MHTSDGGRRCTGGVVRLGWKKITRYCESDVMDGWGSYKMAFMMQVLAGHRRSPGSVHLREGLKV